MSSNHLSILIAALGVSAMADRVCADEQTAAHKTDTSVIAEGISSNPDAVDVQRFPFCVFAAVLILSPENWKRLADLRDKHAFVGATLPSRRMTSCAASECAGQPACLLK